MADVQQSSTAIETRLFDPLTASVDDWAKFHAYRRVRVEEDYPGEVIVPDADIERDLRRHDPLTESRRSLAVREGDAVLGNLGMSFRREGSPRLRIVACPLRRCLGLRARAHAAAGHPAAAAARRPARRIHAKQRPDDGNDEGAPARRSCLSGRHRRDAEAAHHGKPPCVRRARLG